jgi:PAS domain S-box-containing protein
MKTKNKKEINPNRRTDMEINRMELILDLAPISITIHDFDGRFLYANQKTFDMHGFNRDEFLSLNLHQLDVPESETLIAQRMELLLAQGESTFEVSHYKKDGSILSLEVNARIITWDNKKVILSMASDITERKRTDKALKVSKEQYRILTENIKDVVWILDTETMHFRYVSPSVEKQRGYTQEEILDEPVTKAIPSENDKMVINITRSRAEALLSGREAPDKYYTDEIEQLCKDGSKIWTEVITSYYINPDNGRIEVRGVTRDISERKKAEDELKQALEWQQVIFEGSRDAIFITYQDSHFVAVNYSACDLTGYSREQLLKMQIPDIHDLPDLDAYRNYHQRILDGEEILSEAKVLRKDGKKIDTEFNNKCLLIGGKKYMHTIGRDITIRKKLESNLKKFQLLSLNSRDIILFIRTSDLQILEANQAALTAYGYSREELMMKSVTDLRHPETMKDLQAQLNNAATDGVLFETIHCRKDGTSFPVEINSCGMTIGEDRILLSIIRDITDRKLSEEEIKKNNLLRDVLLDNLPFATLVLKKHSREIVACNKLALEAGAIIGKTCYETLTQCDHSCPFCKAPDLWVTGKEQQVEAEYIGKYWEGRWVPFSDDLYIHYILDITDNKVAEKELINAHEQLKQLYIRQDEIKENERSTISREIHDELGQSLSALKIDLGWTKKYVENNPEIKKRIDAMTDMVSDMIKTVQRISSDLRPGLLDDLGLVPAMEWYIHEFEKRTGIKCQFKSDIIQSNYEKQNLTLYRILQEGLTNVMRHSNAKNADINLYMADDFINLEISDDGTGLTPENISSSKSLGFIGIRERLNQFNGSLGIISSRDQGTRLTIKIPII